MRFLSLLKKLVGSILLSLFLALLNNCIDFFYITSKSIEPDIIEGLNLILEYK